MLLLRCLFVSFHAACGNLDVLALLQTGDAQQMLSAHASFAVRNKATKPQFASEVRFDDDRSRPYWRALRIAITNARKIFRS